MESEESVGSAREIMDATRHLGLSALIYSKMEGKDLEQVI
jgi:hypothetical protein